MLVTETKLLKPFPRPKIQHVTDKIVQLLEEFEYVWKSGETYNKIVVPEGFRFDGASVPRLLWTITGLNPFGSLLPASVFHDFLDHKRGDISGYHFYWDKKQWKEVILSRPWTVHENDKLFKKINIEAGVKKKHVNISYFAVSLWARLGLRVKYKK